MFDFIVNNIFVLIPVAILIGIRIVNARRKSQEAAGNNDKNVTRRIADEDHRTVPAGIRSQPQSQPAKKRTAKPAAAVVSAPEIKPAPVHTIQEKRDFTEKLKYLSPLQRAVAFSEILGPPKGI